MLTILINAYACSPDMGSEPGMAWNWCVNLAKHCELHIITEGEFRDKIEAALPQLPQGKNMHFYYNPVPEKVRQMCWNQGDWRFYWYYSKWQKRTLDMAKEIIKEHHIDVLHQLNMIGFREPGYLWKIKDIPFVWGPIGGMELVPTAYLQGESIKTVLKNRIKNIINSWQMHHQPRVLKAIQRADMLVAATGGAYRVLHDYHKCENVVLINETGCYETNTNETKSPSHLINKNTNELNVLWVGKFDFRKQLQLALYVMATLKNFPNIHLHVLGSGNETQTTYYNNMVRALNIAASVTFHGQTSHADVLEMMSKADLLLFTSIADETSTVVLEAIGAGLPVVCFNAGGFGAVVGDNMGRTIELSNPNQSIKDFHNVILELYAQPELISNLSATCKQKSATLTWDYKARQMVSIYEQISSK